MKITNTQQLIDQAKFNKYHLMILLWCSFLMIFDGFDLTVYGAVVPVLMKNWNISPIEAGVLGSYALFGMMFGAMIFGTLADKLGRKKVILICVCIFSIFMILTALTTSPGAFGLCRFITGLGLGGVMPNVIALISEYSPKALRSRMVSIMMAGYSIGGMIAATLSIVLVPNFGWQSVFFFAGLPLLFIPFMIRYLPDTIGSHLARKEITKTKEILGKLNPLYSPDYGEQLTINSSTKSSFPVFTLFKERRGISTILFWIAFFMSLLMVYGLNTWLPKLMTTAGFPLGSSLSFLLALNIGATIGAFVMGWLADTWGAKRILILFYSLAALTIMCLGYAHNMFLLYLLVALAGAATIGTQNIANSYVSQYYPISMRSTGLGWALGIGRIGAIVGPTVGGILLSSGTSIQFNFIAFAIPGAIAAFVIYLTNNKLSSLTIHEDQTEQFT
ncbi:aromatic acid/H+ symport family MFS transporter [Bacillus sp. ISL-18]|uniref:MFS transporter n=1 Tax=Bacillus sp. ISL-18 TaxID=2819118 RepID=UPI001BE8BF44|nr:aromatic acid/H+ symport family MFS transporter [Bacillus sp. ISL-18]MBT2654575.1 aromatic acid/H+ symport family MFS transporter [Bacillus sp. ISL-18]